MEIKICYSPYTLEFHSGAKRKGCLLRVEQEGEYGYADLHPWPEIGDGDLNQQLQLLKAKQSTPLLKRALYFAAVDREARKKQISLLTQSIPKSHYLSIGGYIPPLTELKEAGFTHIKIKIGKDPKQDALTLLNLSQEEHFNNFTLRLDANTKYSPDQFQFFFG